jgi:rod shape-determining protein MreB
MPFGFVAPDIGIDLGTCNFRLSVKGKGIVVYEPTIAVVRNNAKRDLVAIGADARLLLGRTAEDTLTVRPVVDSVISDFDMTEMMLRYFIRKAIGAGYLGKPRMVITVPCGLTDVERRAVNEAARVVGARAVHTVDQPFAAALGTGLPVYDPTGSMLVNIGGGTTEAALISLNGIVVSRSIRVAGNKMDEAIVNYMKRAYNMLISEHTAEMLKMDLGSAMPPSDPIRTMVRGRDLLNGLPMTVELDSLQIYDALREPLAAIVAAVRWVLERTPPELAVDVLRTGIYLTGGSAQLSGIDALIATELDMPVLIARDASDCAALGVGYLAENVELISRIGKGETLMD